MLPIKMKWKLLEKKTSMLDTLKAIEFGGDLDANLEAIKGHIAEWRAIGRVPFNKRYIEGKFNKVIDGLFNKLDMSKTDAELLKYDNKLESLANSENKRLLDNEHNYIRKKIDEIKTEINQLENNLQFFSNVKDDNPLVKDVHKKIDRQKASLEMWKLKLKKVKQFY